MESVTTLQTLIDWLMRVGAMYLAFWLTERLAWPENSEVRRYVSFVIAAVIGLCAWLLGIEFGYITQPAPDWHAWVESAVGVVLIIVVGSQVAHARVVLSQEE